MPVVPNKYIMVLFMMVSLQVPGLTGWFRYVSLEYSWLIFSYLLICGAFYIWLNFSDQGKEFVFTILDNFYLTIAFLTGILILSAYWYPIIDGRKALMIGSDQDDAVIQVVEALFSGKSPYAIRTYLNNVPSPGPGLVLILSPFVLSGLYYIATPFFIGLLCYGIYSVHKSKVVMNLMLFVLASSPIFWKLLLNGSDFIVVGVLFVLPVLLLDFFRKRNLKWVWLLLVAMILTSRLIYVYLAPLYIILFYGSGARPKRWIPDVVYLTLIVVGIHAVFFFLDPNEYSPLHLWYKGYHIFGEALVVVGVLLMGLLTIWTLNSKNYELNNILYLWGWIISVLLIIAFGELYTSEKEHYKVSLSHLAMQIPAFVSFFTFYWYQQSLVPFNHTAKQANDISR